MAKNTHLEHLEDDILNQGSQGGRNAITFLRELGKMLSERSSSITVTTKWDGAPAIVCGTDPSNGKFFVGTKSVFAKTEPKLCYTQADISKFYGVGQLADKLQTCLANLRYLNIKGVIQGDLLFTDDKQNGVINGENVIYFRPNTITYAVPSDSDLGKKINTAKMGIVFHTSYSGPTVPEMNASFGVDISNFNSSVNVYVATGESKFIMASLFKRFFNSYISQGKTLTSVREVAGAFGTFYSGLLDKEILSKKTKATQDKYLQMKNTGLQFIKANERAIYMTVASYMNLQAAKSMVIGQLAKVNTFGTFLKTDDGYKVTAPEGFVAIKSGNALKLVDRVEFSRANFTVAKDWDRG